MNPIRIIVGNFPRNLSLFLETKFAFRARSKAVSAYVFSILRPLLFLKINIAAKCTAIKTLYFSNRRPMTLGISIGMALDKIKLIFKIKSGNMKSKQGIGFYVKLISPFISTLHIGINISATTVPGRVIIGKPYILDDWDPEQLQTVDPNTLEDMTYRHIVV